jgi:ATP-dependent Clp protease ATP-binding subunit ClpC
MKSLSYTQRARNIMKTAPAEAKKLQALEVESIHVLLAAASEKGGVAERLLEMMELPYERLLQEVTLLNRAKGNDSTEPALSSEVKALDALLVETATDMGHTYIGTEHILLALLSQSASDAAKILSKNGFPKKRVQQMLDKLLATTAN